MSLQFMYIRQRQHLYENVAHVSQHVIVSTDTEVKQNKVTEKMAWIHQNTFMTAAKTTTPITC